VTEPDDLLAPFVTAVCTTLREMAGVEVVVRATRPTAAGIGPADLTAVLRLVAADDGWLALRFPAATAAALARRVLTEAAGEPTEDMVRDCAGELANVIAGQAKTLTFGTPRHFTLSTPTVGTGDNVAPAGGAWAIEFSSEAGEFSLIVRLPGDHRSGVEQE
jgi:chemotaxis protein CheX